MNNRQAGRRRGRGGQRQGGNPGRPDNGNRIDNRARGNAAQLLEKYKNLATDSQRSGDRVSTEYYLQFADHYFRVLAESRSREDGNQPRRQGGDDDDAEGVEDFGFEGDLGSPAYYQQPPQVQQNDRDDRDGNGRDGNGRDDRPRGNGSNDRDRDDRPRQSEERPRQRDDRPRQSEDRPRQSEERPRQNDERPRQNDDRPRQNDDQPREARPRRDREAAVRDNGEDRPRREREASNDVGEERPRREPRTYGREPAVEPRPDAPTERPAAANDEPPRRGRPRRVPVAEVESEGFDTAVLPPAISTEAAPADEAAAERPRRGRPRRVRNDDEVVPPAA